MVTKRDLMGVRELIRIQRTIAERMESIRASVTLSSPSLDGMPHGGEYHDRMAEYMAQLDELERDIGKTILRLESEILRIETEIETLQPREQMIIRLRYIDGLSWRKIAARTHYAERHCKRLHKTALEILLNS